MSNDALKSYYAQRAQEYEEVYAIPERQDDLRSLRTLLQLLLNGQDVLEVACGTGYWTEPLAHITHSIVATDVNEEVLAIAREKAYLRENVRFQQADAFNLGSIEVEFSAGFAGFWWSHIRLGELGRFLVGFHAKLGPGKLVVFCDNTRRGTRHPFTRTDEEGNTYQTRRLNDGSVHEVLKNIPTEAALTTRLEGMATDIAYIQLTYYWCLSYRTP